MHFEQNICLVEMNNSLIMCLTTSSGNKNLLVMSVLVIPNNLFALLLLVHSYLNFRYSNIHFHLINSFID